MKNLGSIFLIQQKVKKIRGGRRLEIAGVMEDAMGKPNGLFKSPIQETGQEQRPARMVGLSSLDSARPSTDAGCDDCGLLRWEGGV